MTDQNHHFRQPFVVFVSHFSFFPFSGFCLAISHFAINLWFLTSHLLFSPSPLSFSEAISRSYQAIYRVRQPFLIFVSPFSFSPSHLSFPPAISRFQQPFLENDKWLAETRNVFRKREMAWSENGKWLAKTANG